MRLKQVSSQARITSQPHVIAIHLTFVHARLQFNLPATVHTWPPHCPPRALQRRCKQSRPDALIFGRGKVNTPHYLSRRDAPVSTAQRAGFAVPNRAAASGADGESKCIVSAYTHRLRHHFRRRPVRRAPKLQSHTRRRRQRRRRRRRQPSFHNSFAPARYTRPSVGASDSLPPISLSVPRPSISVCLPCQPPAPSKPCRAPPPRSTHHGRAHAV